MQRVCVRGVRVRPRGICLDQVTPEGGCRMARLLPKQI